MSPDIDNLPLLRSRRGVLAICCLSLFLVSVDNSIINVALPAMSADFHAQITDLQWIVDAYALMLASFLIMGGSLGDKFGRKPIFMAGMILFGVGSLLCSFAMSPTQLVSARVFQALGGSMLNPVALAIIANVFTDLRERARAIGVWGAVNGLGAAAGPLLGGILVSSIGWRSIFWINVPVVVAGVLLTAWFVPNSKASVVRRFDLPGQILMLVFMASMVGSIIEGPRMGWQAPLTKIMTGSALFAFIAWCVVEWRSEEPLIDLRFFRNYGLSASVCAAILSFASIGGFMFVNTLYLQDVRGLSPFESGVAMLPVAMMSVLLPPLSGDMVAKNGPALPLIVSGLALAISALLIFVQSSQAPLAGFIAAYFMFGVGAGLVNAPITNGAVSSLPHGQAGVAAGIAATARQIGMSLGIAIAGSIIANGMAGSMATGLFSAARPLWLVVAGWGIAISVLGLLFRLHARAPISSTVPAR